MLAYLVEVRILSEDQMAVFAAIGRRWSQAGSPSTSLFNTGYENARASTNHGRDRLAAERLGQAQMHELLHELAGGGLLNEAEFRAMYERSRPKGPGPEERALAERNAREAAVSDRFIAVTPKTAHAANALEAARRAASENGLEVRLGESKFFESYRRSEALDDRQIMIGPIPPNMHQRLLLDRQGLFTSLGRFGPTANVNRAEFMAGRPIAQAR
jgi:hypothetical protein